MIMTQAIREAIQLRAADETDIPFLMVLRERTMRLHLENSGLEYESEEQLTRVTASFEHARIVQINGVDAGLLKLHRDGNPWYLHQIQIAPEFQGKGHGEAVVRTILAEAAAAGVGVELYVLKVNPARRLYEKLGFRVFDEDELEYRMRTHP
ncbi:MAG TPA: GNAT family N-acetyltransferase [Paucimonas sp.]|nr:GNAT family N-acetyltransferase [Paucimonas sp.]